MGKSYTLKRGETFVQIAHRNGFRAWEPIWRHEQNAALRAKRPNAYVLSPGDQLYIPDRELADHNCQTNQKHIFRVRSMTQVIHQVILDENEQALAGKAYELTASGVKSNKRLDGQGALTEEVPISTKTAELKVWVRDGDDASCLEWTLHIGHLEPVTTTYGLKSHLVNLGYDCGAPNDQIDQKTIDALRDFQLDHGLSPTGQNDDATQDALLALHSYAIEGSK